MIITYNGITPQVAEAAFVAENATVTGDTICRKDSSVWFGAVIRGDGPHIEIGEGSNIQDGCVLHADPDYPLTVGTGVTVGHGAILHGCTVGSGSLIGMGAIVLNGAKIGKEFEDGMLILGSPAKAIRKLSPEEIEGNRHSAEHYVQQAKEYGKEKKTE